MGRLADCRKQKHATFDLHHTPQAMRPIAIPTFISQHDQPRDVLQKNIDRIRDNITKFNAALPDATIIIPAFNEQDNILKTLSSLSASSSKKKIEIIVVNNNSADATGELSTLAGARCVFEEQQSITAARNTGLRMATGNFILNADADTIYPPDWIDLMLEPLYRDDVAMVYGNYAFLPTTGTSRFIYFAYEYVSDVSKWMNKKFREEAVNIYGSNSAFRREEGIMVGGFDHPPEANEDGWLGLKLRNTLHKSLVKVEDYRALVWTTDRRIQLDGGLWKGSLKRLKRHLLPS